MKNMLGRETEVEATSDLEVYQSRATGFPIVARTLRAELSSPRVSRPMSPKHNLTQSCHAREEPGRSMKQSNN